MTIGLPRGDPSMAASTCFRGLLSPMSRHATRSIPRQRQAAPHMVAGSYLGAHPEVTCIRQLAKQIHPELIRSVSVAEMRSFLMSHAIAFGQGHTCFSLDCILCTHVGKAKKIGTLYINRVTGMFLCHSCRMSGTWHEFQDYVAMLRRNRNLDLHKLTRKAAPDWELTSEEVQQVQTHLRNSHLVSELDAERYDDVTRQFDFHCIRQETASKYNVRISKDETQLLFPVHGVDSNVAGIRMWKRVPSAEKNKESVYPKKAGGMLFGLQRITSSNKELVLTTSPVDTMAVSQELGCPSLSLPKGIAVLPQELLPALEQFSKITMWFGNTVEAWEAARMFARKLGEQRCSFIRPKEMNLCPFQALTEQQSLKAILKDSHPVGHKSITSFSNLREDVLTELRQVEQVAGVKWQRFPHLNKLLKGHRRGELTVLTGPTGSGKTTFMSEYSLDLCVQGVSTLWGSFEIKNIRLAKTMLIQFSQLPLDKHLERYDDWANKFEQLPLYFMTFHGQESFKNVLEAMFHAVYVYDIRHVVLDNLQFMLGVSSRSADRFWLQDIVIAEFRKFASMNNVHVTLVIHPRKERDMEELNNTSIFGGAKASQEADNILILQDKRLSSLRGKKYIQVRTRSRKTGSMVTLASCHWTSTRKS